MVSATVIGKDGFICTGLLYLTPGLCTDCYLLMCCILCTLQVVLECKLFTEIQYVQVLTLCLFSGSIPIVLDLFCGFGSMLHGDVHNSFAFSFSFIQHVQLEKGFSHFGGASKPNV